jgi:pantothenate kinase
MALYDARVNLRLTSETLAPYTRLAALISSLGQKMTATELIRAFVEAQQEQAEMLCTYAAAAANGDKASAKKVFNALMDWNESYIELAREAEKVSDYPIAQTA